MYKGKVSSVLGVYTQHKCQAVFMVYLVNNGIGIPGVLVVYTQYKCISSV